jgi:hypothetical protein
MASRARQRLATAFSLPSFPCSFSALLGAQNGGLVNARCAYLQFHHVVFRLVFIGMEPSTTRSSDPFFLLIHSGSLPFPRGETDQKTTELVQSRSHCAKRQQAGFHCITDPSGDKSAVHTGMKQVIPLGIRTGSQDRMAGLQITVGVVLLQKEEY